MKYTVKILCLLLALLTVLPLAACKDGKVEDGASWQPNVDGEGGNFVPTIGLFVYYIFDCSYSFTEQEYIDHGFDEKAGSLKKIMYDEENTWYDELLRRAKETLEILITYCNAAVADGFEITAEDKQAVEENLVQARTRAAIEGYEYNDMLKEYYGCDYITEDVIREVAEMQMLWDKYYLHLEEKFGEEVTDDEIAARIKSDGLTDTSKTKNIAILLFPVTDMTTADSEEELIKMAEDHVKSFEGKTPDKDTFLNGNGVSGVEPIYYENVYDGGVIADINDWLYSKENPPKVGDMEVINMSYGPCALYYVGEGVPMNESQAKERIVYDRLDAWLEAAMEKFNVPVSDAIIDAVDLDI